MLTDLDERWLSYARSIVACDAPHRAECRAMGGGVAAGPDPDLRWPGVVGRDYEASRLRLLCMAQIHNPTGWSNSATGLAEMEPLLRRWLSGTLQPETFLSCYREEYANRLATWGPWLKAFGPVCNDVRVSLAPTEIAYTNIAKCWLPPGTKQYGLMRSCERWNGVASLISIIKPHAVVVLSGRTPLRDARIVFPSDVSWRNFSGPYFNVPAEDIEDIVVWLSEIVNSPKS
jgi:hypothetical protein